MFVIIQGQRIMTSVRQEEVIVDIGSRSCNITSYTDTSISCIPPQSISVTSAIVMVQTFYNSVCVIRIALMLFKLLVICHCFVFSIYRYILVRISVSELVKYNSNNQREMTTP